MAIRLTSATAVAVVASMLLTQVFSTAPTCAKSKHQCAGEKNHPHFEYQPCCSKEDECLKAPQIGWGKYCIPKGTVYEIDMEHHDEEDDHTHEPASHSGYKKNATKQKSKKAPMPTDGAKCYEDDVKCQGAPGKPYYEYRRCCNKRAKCQEDKSLGWGKFCKVQNGYKAPKPEPEYSEEHGHDDDDHDDDDHDDDDHDDGDHDDDDHDDDDDDDDDHYKSSPTTPPTKAPTHNAKCYKKNEKCMGARGQKHYQYKPCCGKNVCMEDKSLGRGKFCKAPMHDAKKCYGKNEKCIGAKGDPHHPYKPCCGKYVCKKDKSLGRGQFCKAPTGHKKPQYAPKAAMDDAGTYGDGDVIVVGEEKPEAYATEEPTYKAENQCYESGIRCMGAKGRPYVEWKKCCHPADSCVEDASMGWGSFCKRTDEMAPEPEMYVKPKKSKSGKKAAVDKDHMPPTTTKSEQHQNQTKKSKKCKTKKAAQKKPMRPAATEYAKTPKKTMKAKSSKQTTARKDPIWDMRPAATKSEQSPKKTRKPKHSKKATAHNEHKPHAAHKSGKHAPCVAAFQDCDPDEDCCAKAPNGKPSHCKSHATMEARAAKEKTHKTGMCTPEKY